MMPRTPRLDERVLPCYFPQAYEREDYYFAEEHADTQRGGVTGTGPHAVKGRVQSLQLFKHKTTAPNGIA